MARSAAPSAGARRGGALGFALVLGLGLSLVAACGGKDPGAGTGDRQPGTERYYVRLQSGSDPGRVAARHGVEPLETVTEHATAFYAALTEDQVRSLRGDTLVVSVSREIHRGGDTARIPLRGGMAADTPADSGGS